MGVQVFGRYELVRLAGAGGMAQVHLARQVGPEGFVKPCVLKRIALEHVGTESVRRMFLEEARLSALLNHPNIVQTFDFGEVDGTPYLAMELLDGVNLAQLCRTLAQHDRWLPLQPAVEIAAAVLEALDYAHKLRDLEGRDLQLVHRDVSPQNTLLSRQGTVKLSDFGIARHEARDTRTVGLQAKGKPGYMAPEQAMMGQVDARADLFSVGVMLAELVSARRVLSSKNRVNHVLDIDNRVRTLCALRKEAPPELTEFIVQMCALEPARRPATARDAAALLRKSTARIPPSVPLPDFLRSVFELYLTQDPEAAPAAPTVGLAAPPELSASASDLRFERQAWDAGEVEITATEAVYEQGWPSRYMDELGKAPPPLAPPAAAARPPAPAGAPHDAASDLELVPHSSSVDAMQFFQAQVSEDVANNEISEEDKDAAEAERARQHRLPYTPTVGAHTQGSLPSPVFSDAPAAAPAPTEGGLLGFEDPNLKQALANITEDGRPTESKAPAGRAKRSIPPVVLLLALGLVVVGLAVGVLALVSGGKDDPTPKAPLLGSVEVSSDPPGGRIFLNGRDTQKTTPAVLEGLPADKPMRLALRRPGHRTVPPDVTVRIPQGSLRTTARFTLQPGRAYRVETEPAEAAVTVNGHRLGEVTPVTLPVVPFGESATIAISLDGHLPRTLVIDSRAQTPTVAAVKLEPGRSIEISSNPPGAKVFLDGEPIGQTPIYDVLVPLQRRFKLQMRHRGFKPWRKRLYGKRLADTPVVVDLQPLPFLALPWPKQDRRAARDIDRERAKLARQLKNLERQLQRAQERQARVESSVNASVGDLAEVQRRTDVTREAVGELEQELADLDTQMQSMREQLLLRMEGE